MYKNEFFSHYTTVQTLPEFLKEDAFFYGTHTDFLNDPTEKEYALKIFDNKLNALDKKKDDQLYKSFSNYIMSFSNDIDNINQWRAYTSSTEGGFSIVFNKNTLNNLCGWDFYAEKDQMEQIECTGVNRLFQRGFGVIDYVRYNDNDINTLFNNYSTKIDDFIKANSIFSDIEKKYSEIYIISYYRALFSCFVKNDSYMDEKEYRVAYISSNKNEIKMIGGKPRKKLFPVKPEMIHKIIVSPHGNTKYNKRLAEILCENIGLKKDIVKLSSIPYKG